MTLETVSNEDTPLDRLLPAAILRPGQVYGGRFEVTSVLAEDSLGARLGARDVKTGRHVFLRVVAPKWIQRAGATEKLRADLRIAATLTHKSILATYGAGNEPAFFIATEGSEAPTLAALLAERRERGWEGLSLRGAYHVLASVAAALDFAKERMTHGALRPEVVHVGPDGRITLGELGASRALVQAFGASALPQDVQAYLAPEVRRGAAPTERSDVYGLGVVLYAMLTGRRPEEEFLAPSRAHPDGTSEIDQVLARAMAEEPRKRFASAEDLQNMFATAIAGAPPAQQQDFGPANVQPRATVELDVDLSTSLPPAGAEPHAQPQEPAPALRSEPTSPSSSGRPMDLEQLLAKISANDAHCWMFNRDGLDHGPVAGRELVQLILKGEVRGDHWLTNIETREREKVRSFPDFAEFVTQYELKAQHQARAAELQRTEIEERRTGAFKFVLAGVIALVLIGAVVAFVMTRKEHEARTAHDAKLADLYERGQIDITGTAGILPDVAPRTRGAGGARRSGGGAGGLSYEEAMNQAVDLGDVTGGGNQQQLSSSTVAGVMNQNLNALFACVGQEIRQGGGLGRVQIDIAIAGDGHVLGSSVNAGSPEFRACIGSRVRQVRFPSFGAPRMGARYSFAVE